MSLIFLRQSFSPSCLSGGTWYACASGSNFVGCCTSEPCSNGCSEGNLAPASFDPGYYGKFPDQQCPKGSNWYSCQQTSPPFLGCCKSNACDAGCPLGDLTAAFLDSNPKVAAPFLPSGAASSASAAASSSSTSSNKGSTSTSATTTASSAATSSSSFISSTSSAASSAAGVSNSPVNSAQPVVTSTTSPTTPVGAIAGGAVGGVAVFALLIGLLLFYCRRKTGKSQQHMSSQRVGPEKSPLSKDVQGVETVQEDSKHGIYEDSPYSTPTPMYTPYNPSNPSSPTNPTGYPSVSELDNTLITTLPKNSPHPSYELPSPDPPATNASWELSSANSTRVRRKDALASYEKVPPRPTSGGW